MYRRAWLRCGLTLGSVGLAGCLSRIIDDRPDGVVLDSPSDQLAESEALSYPAYGEPIPAFELADPIGGTTVDSRAVDRTAIYTAFFAFCPAECGILLNQLAGVQGLVAEAGVTDAVGLYPITFDPERDDADQLRENADMVGADLDAGNWQYLRPETPADAKAVVQEQLGIGFERETESDRVPGYDFAHPVITLLVNPDGVVERAYRGEQLDRTRVFEDVSAVVDAFDSA